MKIWLSLLIFTPTFLGSAKLSPAGLYIWNVGQGSWATEVTSSTCFHFDMGGEVAPLARISRMCSLKKNILYLSHWDWDHFSYLHRFRQGNPNLCLVKKPDFAPDSSHWKQKFSEQIPTCDVAFGLGFILFIYAGNHNAKVHKQNALSLVYFSPTSNALFPGDSTRNEEKYWNLQPLRSLRIFLLGHHGSLTSTSLGLLDRMPRARMAIASSRFARYRHPHPKVVTRLGQRKIPLLRTEIWGNLIFLR